MKNRSAIALQRSGDPKAASRLARLRWTPEERARQAEIARATGIGRLGGRPRSNQPRCLCGKMTAKRAKARGHKCA